ncbi:agmatinase [Kineosporia sp. A_224]|uniref:agmatinase n=1 Tax=Kineosporia sp. A_224 TaxID=1962180 RepID=UPI0018EA02EF|nr:agmatinase [Kineosporia sp. A_224]
MPEPLFPNGPKAPATDEPAPPAPPVRAPGPLVVNRPTEMGWSGISTFMKLPVCMTPEDLRAGEIDVAIGGAPWEGTASGWTGTHLGPRAIREADPIGGSIGRHHLDVRVSPFEVLKVADYGDADVLIGNTEGSYENIRSFTSEILSGGAVPIILGGDHGITWPVATAVAEAYGYGKIGIIHFDAHADTAPDMRGALAGHGTPMRRLIESGAVPGKNFVQVGLRGYWPEPPILEWMEENQMRTHFMAEIRKDGFDAVLERALDEALDQADHLYISLDVDVADPAFTPGTGTPEPGGLTSQEMLRTVRRLAAEVGMVAMDVVEVSPPNDSGPNITALFANRCVMEALTGTAMRRLGLTDPDYIDPRSAGTGTPRRFRDAAPQL